MQPITLIFVLDRNDIYTSQIISSVDKDYNNFKSNILNNNVIKPKNNEIDQEQSLNIENKLRNLKSNYEKKVNSIIKNNNINKFNQIKFILRNVFLSIVLSIAFFKLSKIRA